MSKQINFFISPSDLAGIFAFLDGQNILNIDRQHLNKEEILLQRFSSLAPNPLDKYFLVHADFAKEIYLPEEGMPKMYGVDVHKSNIITFSPGIFPQWPKLLRRGRFYAETSYLGPENESIKKTDSFKKWVDKFYKSFKKEFLETFYESKGFSIYATANLKEWMKENDGRVDRGYLEIAIR